MWPPNCSSWRVRPRPAPTNSSSSSPPTWGYGEPGDEAFVANAKGLLDGSVAFDGLEIDNNFRWTIINALSTVNAIDQAGIDAELAKARNHREP